MASESSGKEFLATCEVCGDLTSHRIIGDRPETDEDGQTFRRAQCQRCGTHKRLSIDPNDNNIQGNAIHSPQR